MILVFMLSSFPAAGLKIVGYTQKPKPRSTCTQRIGVTGPSNEHLLGVRRMAGAQRLACIFRCLMVATTLATTSAFAADPDNGRRLARRWCAPCHVVALNQRGTTGEAPPFATIANRPDFDAARLALFLLEPHPKMPNMGLSRTDAGDLAAYIATLK